jgi:hypothetical protein
VDDAEHRALVVHQRDVDRELAVPLHELLGAVERIHHPQPVPFPARGKGRLRRLFGQHRDLRRDAPEAGEDQLLGAQVRLGERRTVRLFLDAERGRIDLEDCAPGLARERGHVEQQPVRVGRHFGSGKWRVIS